MTRRELWSRVYQAAAAVYDVHEARAVTSRLCEAFFALRFMDVFTEPNAPYPLRDPALLERIVAQTVAGRPVQYIIGHTEFCGLNLAVREGALIPRPETAELVAWILAEQTPLSGMSILDIGTGSGAIALALAAGFSGSGASILGVDISPEALAIARENATLNKLAAEFAELDVLTGQLPDGPFDLIVSNPPYVTQAERRCMHRNVLDHEPSIALFVGDDDPLIFYRAIATRARSCLRPGGALYFEINEAFGPKTIEVLETLDYRDIELRRDFYNKPRMIRALL